MSDNVWLVTAPGRVDATYLFARAADADAFAAALTRPDDPFVTGAEDTPVNGVAAARRLIAAERGDRIEDAGMSAAAAGIREGIAPAQVLVQLAAIGEDESEAAALIHNWAEEDAQRG
jgi:hypothetical protein